MGNLTVSAVFVICLNVIMWLGQASALAINPAGPVYFTAEGSILEQSTLDPNGVVDSNAFLDELPSSQSSINVNDETNIFTDIFNNILDWVKSTPGIKYIYSILAAPYNILKIMNLPNQFVWAIGTFWYLASLFIVLAFLWGRE